MSRKEDEVFESVLSVLDADFKDSLSSEEQLKLYGWFKVARSEQVVASSMFSVTSRAKYNAYQSVAHLSKTEAITQYIQLVQSKAGDLSLDPIAQTCNVALLTLQGDTAEADRGPLASSPDEPVADKSLHETKPLAPSPRMSWISKCMPQPMVPRGKLDTSMLELLYALLCCAWSPKVGSCSLLDGSTLYGLSVRSLFDLYLSTKQFPKDSEIILSPAISIPGMLQIMRNHGLKIVAVDLPDKTTVGVNIAGIREKINSKTVAIMIVNVFGNECANMAQRRELGRLAQTHGLVILEDAAESFAGALPNTENADVSFVSFGLIKTSTAIGGGVAVIRDQALAQQMRRRQETYAVQSRWEYARRVLKAMLLHTIVSSQYIYGFLHDVISKVWDFDEVVYFCQRGFPSSVTIADIRKRPSSALLQVLQRCIHLRETRETVARRIAWAEKMGAQGLYERPTFTSQCTHWLFPVLQTTSIDTKLSCTALRNEKRVDATRGTLIAVDDTVPLTKQLMDRTMYIPVNLPPNRMQSGPPKLSRGYEYGILLCVASLVWLLSGLLFSVVKLSLLCVCVVCFIGWALQRLTGRYYVKSSSAFSEFSFLFDEEARQSPTLPSLDIISKMPQLAVPIHGTGRRSVILTGCTGFVGSMVLRDLLAFRKELRIDKVILLCRSKRGVLATQRVASLLENTMFSFIDTRQQRDLLETIDIDLTHDLGSLQANHVDSLRRVTHVVHCAAAVSFTQSLRDAAVSNISAALNLQQLAASLGNSVKFLHVSTAFVRGERPPDFLHDEKLCPFGPFDPYLIYKSMLGTQYQAAKAMDELGFVNTYTFSKSVCEHLLVRNNPEVVIIRPSIVGPAIETPFEGWYGTFPSTLIAAACLFFRFQWNLWSFGASKVPCLPVDILSRFIVAKAMGECSDCDSTGGSEDDTESFDRVSELSLDSSGCRTESAVPSFRTNGAIFNAAWDHESHDRSQFLWSDYAAGVAQSGSVLNHFSRFRATVALYTATVLIPTLSLSDNQFAILHEVVVMFPLKCVAWIASVFGVSVDLNQLRTLAMLPLLFAPFSGTTFRFQSGFFAPQHFCGRRYLACCVSAADHFITKSAGTSPKEKRSLKFHALAGREALNGDADFWWALTQPSGTLLCRLIAVVLRFVLRRCFDSVTVDLLSFSSIQNIEDADRIILAPTHRSIFDFLLLYFLCFALPELQLGWPLAAAAKEFEDLPLIGSFMRTMGAFFVHRGRSSMDSKLAEKIPRGSGICPSYLVFIEGTRSRDGRLGRPKTGVLRCLHENDKTVVLPLGISYEQTAEQQTFRRDTKGVSSMSLTGLCRWLLDVCCGRVSLGSVHIAASEPLILQGDDVDFTVAAAEIQRRQAKMIRISDYHVNSMSILLDIPHDTIRKGLDMLETKWFPSNTTLPTPSNRNECLYISMQASFLVGPLLLSNEICWSKWLYRNCVDEPDEVYSMESGPLSQIRSNFLTLFSAADEAVHWAMTSLRKKGLTNPMVDHIVQVAQTNARTVPVSLLHASARRHAKGSSDVMSMSTAAVPATTTEDRGVWGVEDLGFWGYRDSRFVVHKNAPDVILQGDRYHLSGRRLPSLVHFISKETMVEIDLDEEAFLDNEHGHYQKSSLTQDNINTLSANCKKISIESKERYRHGSGHSLGDVLAARQATSIRIPDCVVWPNNEHDVQVLVSLARENGWCIIPFGGGTNVSQATRCPSLEQEPRPIISLDTRLLCKIVSIDEDNRLAEVEAGVTGKLLEEELNKKGFTMGHEPDSLEFSTLGGWIATKASGMKRNKYGNIEDIVVAVSVASADGELKRASYGRESCGLAQKDLFLGSEGCLGIITSAQIKIFPLPVVKDYDCALLKDFCSGTQFARLLVCEQSALPASIRLLDNAHFRFGQALRPRSDLSFSGLFHSLAKSLLFRSQSFSEDEVVLVCFVFEGTKQEVTVQKTAVACALNLFDHVRLGYSVGKSSYDMTFTIAYLRDFALTYWCLGESFETFVPWSRVEDLVTCVKKRIVDEHSALMLPGRPFIASRITQLYHEGVCVYFYMCMSFRGIDEPEKRFSALEHAAREEILTRGGSISHHHGVGKMRTSFLQQVEDVGSVLISQKLKHSLDPSNIFGARNGRFYDEGH